MPAHRVFIDAGAFTRTIAIEPNVHLRNQLQQTLPTGVTIGLPILAAQPNAPGDLVLCSHAFYYIPPEEWPDHLERLVSWMSPTGVTIVVLQHRESGCMNMVYHFFGHRFELRQAADTFRAKHGDQYDVAITLEPAHVETPNLSKAYAVAEFMLNLLEITCAPTRHDVETYVQAHFATHDGRYRMPVHQDFLMISRRPSGDSS